MQKSNSTSGYNSSRMKMRKDGRYQRGIRLGGKLKVVTRNTPEEVEAEIEKLKLQAEFMPLTGASTLHDVAKEFWFPRVEALQNPATKSRYIAAYIHHIRGGLGKFPIEDLTTRDIQKFVNDLSNKLVSRSGKGKTVKPMEPAGVRFVYSVLGQITEAAYLNRLIAWDPCNKLIRLPEMPEKRERVLTVEESRFLLESTPDLLKLPVFLALCLGLRRGEACGLMWDDLDRVTRSLQIKRQKDNKGVVRKLKTTASKRTLILHPELIDFIDKHGDLDSPYIVALSPRDVTDFWADWAEKPDGWTFHDLRHACAGLVEMFTGGNVIASQYVLGHTKPDMTNVYHGQRIGRLANALEGMTNVLTNKNEPN
jgi:integrase